MKQGHRTSRYSPDRMETAVFGGLMGAFLAGSPLVAYAAGRLADGTLYRTARLQQTTLRQVPATLVQAAPPRGASGALTVADTAARWRAPDGQFRSGPVPAPGGTAAGSSVMVWVNHAGDLADPPMPQAAIADRVVAAQGAAGVGFAVALAAIGGLAHKNLDKRRRAA